ncbi:MATE family efflux transporter [Anaerobiospirillum sp. NML120448]|uniref:MATE family efflux transporter n=1 Tax=Anaerobiospirillum sp. NML120448 TaxID=2932816 RepID=UPI001FF14B5B|nr:MATE family efflux transporter [Anaerobiospirillum sp. NML120448]MCK0515293.1 MATE family efflux transporter [Anaerobiospirillum sp. NML120448]
MQELEKQHSQESKLLKSSHTENQLHNDDEVLMAQAIHQAQSLDEALKLQDQAQIQATLDNKQEHQSGNNYDAFEASYPAGSDGADVAWTFEHDEAAKVGVNAAAPIVVSTNNQALEAAKIAAVLAAEAGGDKTIQEAAAVAAAAAAAGNSNIDVNVYSQNNLTSDHATKAEINAVNDELDKSLSKLDLQEPKRSLLSLTWPIFIDLSLHFATLIINTIMVGMVSVKAVAELTIGNQVFDLALIIFNFFNIGVCVVCAQALGANNKRLARRLIHVGLGVNLIIGTIVSIAIFMASGFIVDIMQVPEEIKESSHNYLQILSLSFLPLSICLVGSAILRAHNCTRDAMYVSMLVNIITVIGNTLFLFGYLGVPVMGVEGVAISTVLSRTVGCLVFIPLIIARTNTRIIPRFMFVFRRKIISSILSIGLPGAGENLSWHTQYMFMTGVIASMGAMALATQGVYFQIVQVLMLFSISIGMGTELLVAHYTGAMKLDLANKQLIKSVKIGEVVTFLLTFSMPLGTGAFLVSCFTDNAEVLAIASGLFIITVFQEPGRILNIIIINSLRATGDTTFPVIMAVISMWGISVPLGCFLGLYLEWGLVGVWIGFAADEWVRGIAMLLRWKSLAWQKSAKRIYEQTLMQERERSNLKTAAQVQ